MYKKYCEIQKLHLRMRMGYIFTDQWITLSQASKRSLIKRRHHHFAMDAQLQQCILWLYLNIWSSNGYIIIISSYYYIFQFVSLTFLQNAFYFHFQNWFAENSVSISLILCHINSSDLSLSLFISLSLSPSPIV